MSSERFRHLTECLRTELSPGHDLPLLSSGEEIVGGRYSLRSFGENGDFVSEMGFASDADFASGAGLASSIPFILSAAALTSPYLNHADIEYGSFTCASEKPKATLSSDHLFTEERHLYS